MGFFTRLATGWKLSMYSLQVLRENKQLILFPVLSGMSLILIMGSFFTIIMTAAGWDFDNIQYPGAVGSYAVMFLFYLVNYFIVMFFNMALIHCTRLYFMGEELSISKGIQFSISRLGVIASWSLFAATIGFILKVIQENSGIIGKIITGIIGIVWSIATFFVVPVIAYEKLGPVAAFKRSSQMMKDKWGESLGATFSFGIIQLLAILLAAVPLFFIGATVHIVVGVLLAILGAFMIMTIMSAAQTIFISAVYHNINNDPVKHFDQQLIDQLFVQK